MSSSELSLSSSWSSATETMIGLQGRQPAILQALGLLVLSAPAAAAHQRRTGGSVRAGAVPPPRHASSEPAAPASPTTGSGTGGAGSPGDGEDGLLAAAAPSPSPGLTAEMALSILVDCFGH